MTDDELNEMRQFHAEIEEYERANPIDPVRQAAEDAEDLRMPEQYPGEYVSYIDAWDGKTLTRTVLAHAADWKTYREQLEAYSDAQLEEAVGRYIDPPGLAMCTRLLTGEIRIRTDARRG